MRSTAAGREPIPPQKKPRGPPAAALRPPACRPAAAPLPPACRPQPAQRSASASARHCRDAKRPHECAPAGGRPSGWQTPAAATVPDLRPGCISRGTCPGSPLHNTKFLSTHPRASPASMDPRPAVGALDNARSARQRPVETAPTLRAGDRRRALWRRCRRRCAPCAAQLRALRALGALRALRTAAVVELGALCFLRAHGRPCGRRA